MTQTDAVVGAGLGYLFAKALPHGRFLGLVVLAFGRARLDLGAIDNDGFVDSW